MRYKGIKGKFWKVFSEFIRQRDFYKYGTCVACGKTIVDWKYADAGHYVPAGECGFGLLFDEKNVHMECKRCNNPTWSPGAPIPMGLEIDRRLGKGTAEKLWKRKWEYTNEWTEQEYLSKIEKYKKRIIVLNKKRRSKKIVA